MSYAPDADKVTASTELPIVIAVCRSISPTDEPPSGSDTATMRDGDDPTVIAKAIVRAATDPNPKLRYTAGSTAGRVSVLRRIKQIRKLNRMPG